MGGKSTQRRAVQPSEIGFWEALFKRTLREDKGGSNEELTQRVVLVRAYTGTRLSFEKDRLIALSGFTKRIWEKLGLTYAWGM